MTAYMKRKWERQSGEDIPEEEDHQSKLLVRDLWEEHNLIFYSVSFRTLFEMQW